MATMTSRQDWYVVVADDDADWRGLMAVALQSAGFHVFEASDGWELVAHCQALLATPGRRVLIISDVEMPGLGGIDALEMLRGYESRLRVALITGAQSTLLQTGATGVRAVLRKPVSRSALMRAVEELAVRPS
jgi:CheY-like chemotaxis protein